MNSYGSIPDAISPLSALDSIGETIILADKDYNIVWLNSQATKLLSDVAPLFGLKSYKDLIGLNMNRFHSKPDHQRKIMDKLTDTHQARITIRDKFVADIVINPIKKDNSQSINGYVIMLMDVTTKAEEEKEKEKLIYALSTPMLKVWKNAVALPLIGDFSIERFDLLISNVLEKCTSNQIDFVLLDLSEFYKGDQVFTHLFQKLIDCVNLIGTQCILVGIPPALAKSLTDLNRDVLIFSTTYDGLQYITKN